MRWLLPRSRTGMLWRFTLAAVLVVCSCAAAVATAGLLQVDSLVRDFNVRPGIKVAQLHLPAPGKPQTLLIIGSDHRADAPSFKDANTDTMLLVRLNSASSTINVLSIPRDLKVDVPGYGIEKLNAAYSEGGYGLLIRTIRDQVFPGFAPNHIIDTNFTGFSNLVDAIGCVYSDVDHRYYNISSANPDNDFSSIDIQPGYQKLCGDNQSISGALPFVRFRHTDTDIVRNARQQDFLRWAKEGYSFTKLYDNRNRLTRILSRYSTTDRQLHSTKGLLELFDLIVNANGATIKQISFPAILAGPDSVGASFVTALPAPEQAAYRAFLRPTQKTAATRKGRAALPSGHLRDVSRARGSINTQGLESDPADGLAQARALTDPRMPVYYPRLIDSGSDYCTEQTGNCDDPVEPASAYAHSYPRQYVVPIPGGRKVPAWRMTVDINSSEGLYYGIQGIRWADPPLLGNPTATKVVRGRRLFLYADDGGRLTTVAWHQGPDSYWVSNTLTSALPNHELVGIAASMTRYRG